jgi:hypothetical protein
MEASGVHGRIAFQITGRLPDHISSLIPFAEGLCQFRKLQIQSRVCTDFLCRFRFHRVSFSRPGRNDASQRKPQEDRCCDSGFLMSVFSCGAIFIFAPHLKAFIVKHLKAEEKSLVKYFAEAFSVSTVAFLSVLPVSAAVFGKISLASPFSNLFAGFLTQSIIVFGLITVLLGFVPFLSFAAGGTAFIVSVFETLLLMVAKFFAGFSFFYADVSESWFYIWILGSAVLIFVPIIVLKNLRFLKHSLLAAAFVLVFGILLDQIFFSGVAEIKISALEHGTAISCSKDEDSVLITNGVSGSDVYNMDFPSSGFKTVISLNPSSDSAEYSIVDSAKPEKAFLNE